MGGYAEAKRKAEMEAEAKVEESLFFDPPAEIELARNMLDPPPADESKDELISAAPPAPAPRKAKSHKEDLAAFWETYLQPVRISHRKAVYVSDETQQRLDFVVRRIGLRGASISGYVERVLREHLDGYKDSIELRRKLWTHAHLACNALPSTCMYWVQVFRVRTPPILGPGKVCFCDTNCRLYHEKPCPGWGPVHSKVVT